MAVALRKRLADQKDELLRYTKLYGRYRAMDKFGVADSLAFDRLLMEWTNDEHYGDSPQIALETRHSVGDQLVEAILRKINLLTEQNKQLKEQIDLLRMERNDPERKTRMVDEVERLLHVCGDEALSTLR